MFGKTIFIQNIRLGGESVDIACSLCHRHPCSHQRLSANLHGRRRLGLGVGEGGCLGFVCLLFLMSSEEWHFLLKASLCFYTHSKTAVPRKEADRVQGQAGEEVARSEHGILEA